MVISAFLPKDLVAPRTSTVPSPDGLERCFQVKVDGLVEGTNACVEARFSAAHTAPRATRWISSAITAYGSKMIAAPVCYSGEK